MTSAAARLRGAFIANGTIVPYDFTPARADDDPTIPCQHLDAAGRAAIKRRHDVNAQAAECSRWWIARGRPPGYQREGCAW